MKNLMTKRSFLSANILLAALLLAGCATIIHGDRQKIPVSSEPSGATVRVNTIEVMTPGVITLSRSKPYYVLRFAKEGYEPVEVELTRTTDGWLWGNILLGGIIGIVIDFSTGAAYQLNPKKINVCLKSLDYGGGGETSARGTGTNVAPEDDSVVVVDAAEDAAATAAEYCVLLRKIIFGETSKLKGAGSGTVNVSFTLLSDGTLVDARALEGSTDNAALRAAVIDAVKDLSPFPRFPAEMRSKTRKTFTIAITFD